MSIPRRLSTKKILVASLGVAVGAYVTAVGCHPYPVGNLMPPRTPESDAEAIPAPDAGLVSVAQDASASDGSVPVEEIDPRVTSGNLMAPHPRPRTKKDGGSR